MADPVTAGEPPKPTEEALGHAQSRKEKRKSLKKLKRKKIRTEAAIREREVEEARSNDPEEKMRIRLREQEEAEAAERERREFEERERLWFEAAAKRKAEEEKRRKQELLEESERRKGEHADELEEDDEEDYVEDGPAEIIWQGDEIFVKKKRVKVAKGSADKKQEDEFIQCGKTNQLQDIDRPTSNPLPPQSLAFASYNSEHRNTAQELLEGVAQQVPNFGTEQDKAHCPFHLKTGACRFGTRCSRVHFYPDKSCTLLIKNMYNGPGLAWEQDEGLECTDEEVERCYEEFYEDVHTEFLKFGELVNFKVCKNGSYHLRGNVYVHYRSLEPAILAYNAMNGRYFAGKQINCEFIGVTRWKVAICGEYMKSRLMTCSRGSACNFIHCFRNPGGDYEWADWDNHPPKYWMRKMAVLFGHSNESSYRKQMELKDFESPKDFDGKRTPRHGRRYHSRKSHDEIEVHDSGTMWEDSYKKRDQHSSHSVGTKHSRRRKETSFLDKSDRSEENHKSKVNDYDDRHQPDGHDSTEDKSKENDRESLEKHQKSEEKNNREAHQRHKRNHRTKEELSSCQEGESFSGKQEKSEGECRLKSHKQHTEEHRSFDQLSDYTTDRRNQSSSCSSEELYFRHSIDAQDRYDGRDYSNDSDSGREFLRQNISRDKRQASERTMNRYKSRYHTSHTTRDIGRDGKKGKAMKVEANDGRSTSGEPPDRWEATHRDSGAEDSDGHLSNGSSSHGKPSKSYEKYKYHREKRKHEVNSSSSDKVLDRRVARRKFSQSQTPGHSGNLEEKRIQPRIHTS